MKIGNINSTQFNTQSQQRINNGKKAEPKYSLVRCSNVSCKNNKSFICTSSRVELDFAKNNENTAELICKTFMKNHNKRNH